MCVRACEELMRRQIHKRTRKRQHAPILRARFVARLCRLELLEPRLPLSADASPFAPASFTTQANGLPILTSFPTAPAPGQIGCRVSGASYIREMFTR